MGNILPIKLFHLQQRDNATDPSYMPDAHIGLIATPPL